MHVLTKLKYCCPVVLSYIKSCENKFNNHTLVNILIFSQSATLLFVGIIFLYFQNSNLSTVIFFYWRSEPQIVSSPQNKPKNESKVKIEKKKKANKFT
mmetsp:Transcript_63507/g.72782  ORF Transcript_63507/g.72782 Transcript_63507/m.72782 type:complete len:98 (-) Transcript_63507:313-606(-)